MKIILLTGVMWSCLQLMCSAQIAIKRSAIGASGSFLKTTSGVSINSITGQSSLVEVKSNNNTRLFQGFQQPIDVSDAKLISDIEMNLYPNPSSQFIYVEFLQEIEGMELSIYNNTGKKLLTKSLDSMIKQILDLKELSSGVYHLMIRKEGTLINYQKLTML